MAESKTTRIVNWGRVRAVGVGLFVTDLVLVYVAMLIGYRIKGPALNACVADWELKHCGLVAVVAPALAVLACYLVAHAIIAAVVQGVRRLTSIARPYSREHNSESAGANQQIPKSVDWQRLIGEQVDGLTGYWKSFLFAPLLASLPIIWVVIIPPLFAMTVGPVYGYLLVVGVPALVVIRSLGLFGWHYFVATGLAMGLYHMTGFADLEPPHYDLGNFLLIPWLGILGGYFFWLLGPRERPPALFRGRDIPGQFLLFLGLSSLVHLGNIDEPERVAGRMLETDTTFEADAAREVPVELEDKRIAVTLASNTFYRPGCPVEITIWRDTWTYQKSYSFYEYTDVGHTKSRSHDWRDEELSIRERCNPSSAPSSRSG